MSRRYGFVGERPVAGTTEYEIYCSLYRVDKVNVLLRTKGLSRNFFKYYHSQFGYWLGSIINIFDELSDLVDYEKLFTQMVRVLTDALSCNLSDPIPYAKSVIKFVYKVHNEGYISDGQVNAIIAVHLVQYNKFCKARMTYRDFVRKYVIKEWEGLYSKVFIKGTLNEWRPRNHELYPKQYRDAMKTLVLLAKV